jgi:hypothetical protein
MSAALTSLPERADGRARPTTPLLGLVRTPTRFLLTVWAVALGLVFFGPVKYTRHVSAGTWLFLAACLTCFCLGASVGWRQVTRPSPIGLGDPGDAGGTWDAFDRRVDQLARVCAVLGLVGIGLLAFDKLRLSGLDYSQGVTAVRNARAVEVNAGNAALGRSPLLYLGFVTFGFSVPAYLLYVLRRRSLRRSTVFVVHVGLLSPLGFGVIYGGRSPLVLALGMIFGGMLVRRLCGQPRMRPTRFARMVMLGLIVFALVFGSYIFRQRAAVAGYTYAGLAKYTANSYRATTRPWFEHLLNSNSGVAPIATDALLTHFYLTHEVFLLDRTLRYEGSIGPYFGAYQFNLVAALGSQIWPQFDAPRRIISDAAEANTYGYFPTAFGCMYLDFGLIGALVGTLICGLLAGKIFRWSLLTGELKSQLFMCFVIAGIIASPLLSVFTISIALPILFALVVVASCLPSRAGAVAVS